MRRVPALLLASAVAAGSFTIPAAATSNPPSSDQTVVIVGHGFGHGRGMGQWGAKGMAASGATYPAILAHYYHDVTLGSRGGENIRVLLARAGSTIITSDARFQLAFGNGRPFTLSPRGGTFYLVGLKG